MLSARPVKMKLKLPASQRAASEKKNLKIKAFVSILNRLISVRPLEVSPNQIVLVIFRAYLMGVVILSHEGNIESRFLYVL